MASLIVKAKEFIADKIADVPKPEATMTDVSVKHFSRDSATFDGKVSVKNPYSTKLPICEVSYTFKSDGRCVLSTYLHFDILLKEKKLQILFLNTHLSADVNMVMV